MPSSIAIVDYGVGNLRSVENALIKTGATVSVVSNPSEVKGHGHILLPGVGAFQPAISALKAEGMAEALDEHVKAGKPLLGICLGMHLLAESSDEDGHHFGMGWVSAAVRRLPFMKDIKVPHMGWNSLDFKVADTVFDGLESGVDAYFVHSYFLDVAEEKNCLAKTSHGVPFCSIVRQENVYGMQFHPEKSQDVGLRLLSNFMSVA